MKRFLIACFILIFFGCSVFKNKQSINKKNTNQLILYAGVEINNNNQSNTKIKTKIKICNDSLHVSAYHPTMGIEMGSLLLKEGGVEINLNFNNNTIFPTKNYKGLGLQDFRESIIKHKPIRDTIFLKSESIKIAFSRYVEMDGLFVPQSIDFFHNHEEAKSSTKIRLSVEYKRIKRAKK